MPSGELISLEIRVDAILDKGLRMRSIRLSDTPGTLPLTETDTPQPKPHEGEVLIQVYAAGVTPDELGWYPTLHTKDGGKRIAAIPCHEFSGKVAALGDGVGGLSVGQEIYGMNDWFEDGALAEYCVTQPDWIAVKPLRLSHAEAASVPISALTAWQGLFERGQLQPGERVLVHGGAGGVGVYAIQLAHSIGAHVTTTVSPRNVAFVGALGADEVVDYKAGPFEDKVRDIDLVFDTVGGETLHRSWGLLKQNGRLVTIASDSEAGSTERTKRAFFIVEPRHQELVEVGKLIDSGKLQPVVDTVLPFSQAADAYMGKVVKKGRGKLVITVAA